MDRYQYLIDLGRRLPEFPEEDRIDANKIRGCQSQVWFVAERRDGRLHFRAISDAAIVSGLIAMLLRIYSGRQPQDILASLNRGMLRHRLEHEALSEELPPGVDLAYDGLRIPLGDDVT